ncbi:LPXTG cell wall anchor domain-containing protein [Latilactobacillus sakei]|uniref:LPXTG cell wall anchor domain-containing protein n=1 Tax=Latilactobacillus sakei TaxID=1599 RepID=UPI000C128AFB|nr:LPXTG cell wall anchor domain-containing protein [Latilactobacillus sakei]MCB4409570.1 LPXTG cell wall anchor domain-containing protein [Latilactobacillus sakei]QVQ48353.1 LPXTG cell wall anchor domain-containing protein [Latilactobacillus sakei subsp. sakei]WEY49748.1 LPXTG cell wall anchor domain-containing protein [Latilactobacillus sakei]SON71609.1 LPXTG cell wall anchor domain protein [Latilactobacillus sakei]
MTSSLSGRKEGLMMGLLLLMLLLVTVAQPVRANRIDSGQSTASFAVHIDQKRPTPPGNHGQDGGVAQPTIPENGQEIHYTASGSQNATGRLPQTGAIKSTLLSLIGSAIILLVLGWHRQQSNTKEADYDAN